MKSLRKILSSREFRGALIVLPSLIFCAWVVREAFRVDPKFEPTEAYTAKIDSAKQAAYAAENMLPDSLFEFDPNTVDYHTLLRLGFKRNEALGVIKYRTRGKRFEIKEDLASCYTVSEEMYRRLEPYIVIGEEFALRPFERRDYPTRTYDTTRRRSQFKRDTLPLTPFRLDTASVGYLSKIGFSVRQAEVLVKYRDMRGGLRSIEELAECYVVRDEMIERLQPYLIFETKETEEPTAPTLVELNSADSTALVAIRGIGAKTAAAIIDYRRRLGGFYRVEQLSEVRGITEQNYERIVQQIWCDSCEIQKISVIFAPAEVLAEHPYLPPQTLRKLLKQRQLKGGWTTIEEMIDEKIFTVDEAARIAPYLRFDVQQPE